MLSLASRPRGTTLAPGGEAEKSGRPARPDRACCRIKTACLGACCPFSTMMRKIAGNFGLFAPGTPAA